MKKTNILYWIFTSLFAGFMIFSAIPDIMMVPEAVQMVHGQLGYPNYFLPFIGVAKVLGAIAILIPGFPRIKEWAYAGLVFDLLGATYSVIAIGGEGWWFMILPLAVCAVSYTLYHKRKNLKEKITVAGRDHGSLLTSAIV